MTTFSNVQATIALVLGVAVLVGAGWAFVDSLTRRPDAFVAAGKLTKPAWLGINGVATLLAFLVVFNPLSIFGILAVVAAGVYFADVRPALREVESHRGGHGARW